MQHVGTRAERRVLAASYTKSVNASTTLAALFTESLPDNVKSIIINNPTDTDLHINPSGVATAGNARINGQCIDIWGDKDTLDAFQVFTGSAVNISFFVYTLKESE